MKLRLYILLSFVSLYSFSQNLSPTAADEKLNYFLSVADSLRMLANTPGVGIAIVYKGEVLFQGGIGYRDKENQLPVTPNTLFAIGSCSKAFTGVLTARLVQKKLLNWDQPVQSYLPTFSLKDPYVTQNATLKDLHTHMTGLGRHDGIWLKHPKITRNEVLKKLPSLSFDYPFRARPHYNNLMLMMAGRVQEEVSGKAWDQLVKEEIFRPLHMNNSFASYQEFMEYPEKSIGYTPNGKKRVAHRNIDVVGPAGAISSTPRDMAQWIKMFIEEGRNAAGEYLTAEQFTYITHPQVVKDHTFPAYWGIGWAIVYVDGKKIMHHDGGIDGQNAYISICPDEGFGYIIMTNHRSLYKNLLAGYADEIFIKGIYERNYQQEREWLEVK